MRLRYRILIPIVTLLSMFISFGYWFLLAFYCFLASQVPVFDETLWLRAAAFCHGLSIV